ncbi:hypothetical protein Pyrde_0091 [Pyrodictium delaneyi]|uniref:Uncharacterized protein n=1 Tax=Pyrodictium delaneyi TaxID=1273541 RepID=A0A0P0N172_9CREN|nr:hypothetical protein [Pyrodictium delaneyi]ALL00141.1 hypothetical protein Pyrde_0091 [Pyrodictium delaneyi]OWJ54231.1 hypothetical protein Pdsh_06995 [Pyrodictium delaneyi]
MASINRIKERVKSLASRLGPPAAGAAVLVAQTDSMTTTISLVNSVIPVLVLVMVLKLLFSSFKEISKD